MTPTPRGQPTQQQKRAICGGKTSDSIFFHSSSSLCLRSFIIGVAIYTVTLAAFIQNKLVSYDRASQVLSLRSSELTRFADDSITITSTVSYHIENKNKERVSSTTARKLPETSYDPDIASADQDSEVVDDNKWGSTNGALEPILVPYLEPIIVSDVVTPIAFAKWDDPVPCYVPELNWSSVRVQETPTNSGIIFIKPHKTGSSTGAAINLRISRNLAKRQQKQRMALNLSTVVDKRYDVCQSRFHHGRAALLIPNRTKHYYDPTSTDIDPPKIRRSVLWTMIRDPTARSISAFFHFAVSRQGVEPTDTNFMKYVKGESGAYYLKYLYTKGNFNRNDSPQKIINSILQEYDFIGITERMDESAVVLMMLLNLKMSDVLYLRAKTQGGYDDGGGGSRNQKRCTYITPTFISEGMKEFFDSYQWENIILYDQALYKAVNRSLDMTIDSLGRDKFEMKLKKFRFALDRVERRCRSITVFPCDNMGRFHSQSETNCLWADSGCGMSCIDHVSTKLKIW
jgi:Galactose-3-O-sulfotransferase